ncbi:MAG: aspartyl-phosphate phosphatase Spo0E family protein [Gorillibacterium sp.]|nr:aspartyl-phosphate phosphatase Spo0E family protein [Gorillibacterium sp.]
MVYGQGAWAISRGFMVRDRGAKRPYQKTKGSSSLAFLEEEIYMLRSRMVELFEREQSLTSTPVVEASNELDLKINEYMEKTGIR